MQDGFVLGDGMAAELACGHPNCWLGERCPLCGKIVEAIFHEGEWHIQTRDDKNQEVVKPLELKIGTNISKG